MIWCSDWKKLFSSVILQTEFVVSKEVTANNHLPSSINNFGGLNEKVCICLSILNSSVSCGFNFVCSTNVSVCFLIKSNNSIFIQVIQILVLPYYYWIFYCFVKYFCFNFSELMNSLSCFVKFLLFVHLLGYI